MPFEAVDVALDKSSLDATLAEDDVAGLLLAVWRSLKPGGRYVVISLYPRAFLEPLTAPLFSLAGAGAVPRPALIKGPAADDVAVLCFARRDVAAPALGDLRKALNATMDAFFAGEASLLTPTRLAAVEAAFEEAALDLDAAHAALFTPDEREDYALDGFLDDVAAFRAEGESRRPPDAPMDAAEALAFLKHAQ